MDKGKSLRRGFCPMESVSTTFQSLDTVRALHQTVVSLRAALEEAKSEIQRLRSQISTQVDIKEGTQQQVKAKSQLNALTLQNLSENIAKNDIQDGKLPSDDIKQNLGDSPKIVKEISLDTAKSAEQQSTLISSSFSKEPVNLDERANISIVPDISVIAYPQADDPNEMASKIDVKIKVMSSINVEGSTNNVSTASQLPEGNDQNLENISGPRIHVETKTTDALKGNKNAFGDLVLPHSSREPEKEEFQSENDAVFIEKTVSKDAKPQSSDKDQEVIKEEVDDIELIFSSEENKEPIQEDLVSISEYDPWQATGTSDTPVLVKFASLPSEQYVAKKGEKDAKITFPTTYDAFYEGDNASLLHEKNLESTNSYENESTQKSSSLDKETDSERMDRSSVGKDESFDFFDHRDVSAINRKWTNCNVLVETDISKCGIIEEQASFEMYRRNTCPNPPAYKPILTRHIPSRLGSRFCRRGTFGNVVPTIHPGPSVNEKIGPKRSSSAQTEISALPDYWKSESQLNGNRYHMAGPCTLPSKFVPTLQIGCPKHNLRISERTQEARRVLLSDINFTSMVPELSRSADHLCQDEGLREHINKQVARYYKGNLLKTPDYALKGITPSVSMTSPGVSQWTVNENSFGTQTIQTGESWGKRGDSFDSCRSYSTDSRCSGLDPHHRSRSVPSIRCAICKQSHANGNGIRTSESMHYTPRVTFQEPACRVRGSLPDLRHDCVCFRRYTGRSLAVHRDSSGSTESLLDEAETFIRKSMDSSLTNEDISAKRPNLRRMSENDIQRDFIPSKQSLPFLPKTAKCLKPGHLAKVISKNGRVVVGRVKYVGPLIETGKTNDLTPDDLYVGVQLQSKCGDTDGTYEGRRIFECEPLQGLFVPFKKVVMAWTG